MRVKKNLLSQDQVLFLGVNYFKELNNDEKPTENLP